MSDIFDTQFEGKEVEVGQNLVSYGADINIMRKDPSLKRVHIGVGWDVNNFSGEVADVDISVFLLGREGKTREDADFIFYNNMSAQQEAIVHNGDSRTGAGDGDDESISIDLTALSFEVLRVAFVLSIYQGEERGQSFDQVDNAFIRVVNADTNIEIVRYNLDKVFQGRKETGMIVAFLNRAGPNWHFIPQEDFYKKGLKEIAEMYGCIIAKQ